ncbi:response regulator transcription factor [Hymenobacter sp. GOD-10R]|uniref:response regulator transcription factor n=1 Tax=Hymenobacter sp. GOD-10R TaxID=3093922 RepID=UPI002D775A70|nr:response regulator transcription factor [Hymenobacter sp. GOD-10R]WRQ31912.1 response regulator transcription factor [Hymenobacter sp. GOD-10R]
MLHGYRCRQSEFDCVAVAGSVDAFLVQLPDLVALPHLVLLDSGLPGLSSIAALPLLRQLPNADFVLQTVFEDTDRIYQALCAGASGYLLKSTPPADIKAALFDVAWGVVLMSQAVARKVLGYFKPSPVAPTTDLTPHERQVLEGLVEGLSEKQVVLRLDLAPQTVHSYSKQLYRKLHVRSRAEFVCRTLRDGPLT